MEFGVKDEQAVWSKKSVEGCESKKKKGTGI